MSIQFRLNAAIGALLATALLWIVATMIVEAGPRVRAESASIMRLSKGLIEPSLTALGDAKDPAAALDSLVAGLKDLRHVRIWLEARAGHDADASPAPEPKRSWLKRRLARLIAVEPSVERLPVDIAGRRLGTVVLASKPADEVNEVLDEIADVAWRGLLLAAAVFLLTTLVVNRALQPIGRLRRAMSAMQAGNYDIALPESGPPEMAAISMKLNQLASTLERTRSENSWLSEKVIRVADDERRDLARELHDELGPYLFAVRAGMATLKREVDGPSPDAGRLSKACATLLEQIDAIQRTNRRVLMKLRPVGLAELGLAKALEGLAAMLRNDHASTEVRLDISADVSRLDDTSALTLYRIVQEGLTNAFRHAGATQIDVAIVDADADGGPGGGTDAIRVTVRDNGTGLDEDGGGGFGLTGMRERVWALGGRLQIGNSGGGGVLLEAVVPVARK